VLEARTLHVDAAGTRATYFPPTTPRAGRREVPVVIAEPLLFDRTILFGGRAGGLAPYLASEGFRVWVVGREAGSARDLGAAVEAAVDAVGRETGVHSVDIVGVSLGAEGALHAVDHLRSRGSAVTLRRVAFLGGAFDYAYPGSFGARVIPLRGHAAVELCTLGGDVGCARLFHEPTRAVPWLRAVPAAEGDALAPARERFPFVADLTALPVLFVNGKADGIGPSEAMFPLYALWGSHAADASEVPKRMFLAGRENGLGRDYDAYDLLDGDAVTGEVWERIAEWLRAD
jgi:hypothetical protein